MRKRFDGETWVPESNCESSRIPSAFQGKQRESTETGLHLRSLELLLVEFFAHFQFTLRRHSNNEENFHQ